MHTENGRRDWHLKLCNLWALHSTLFDTVTDWLPLVIARFRSLDHEYGTIHQRQNAQHRLRCHLNDS